MANQFAFIELQSATGSYVPYDPAYTNVQYGTCTLAGSQPGQPLVSGARYIQIQYGDTRSHLWRNLGALFGFGVLFILISLFGLEKLMKPESGVIVQFRYGIRLNLGVQDSNQPIQK